MPSRNTRQTATTTNSYGYMPGASSPDIDAARNFQFQPDKSIGYNYAAAKNQVKDSFNNPLGAYTTPQIRESILRSSLSELSQQEAQAKSEANQQIQDQQFGQKLSIAGLTAPRMVQTSGTSQGTNSEPFFWALA